MTDLFQGGDPSNTTDRDEILNKWKDKTPEDVLRAKVEADLHIKALEREKAELRQMYTEQREELLAKAKWDEYLDRVSKPQQEQPVVPKAEDVQSQQHNPVDFDKLITEKLSAYERAKIESTNADKVQSKLRERYGDNYVSVLRDQQSSLGLSNEDVNSLAKKSPEAFFRVMGLNERPVNDYAAAPRSSQRNDSFSPKNVVRDYNYYQELKKTNPLLYLDPKISLQMERDAQELGERFGLPD